MFAVTASKSAADITPPALVVATGRTALFPSEEATVRVVEDVAVDKSVVTFVPLAVFAATSSKRAADITPPALVVATGRTALFPSEDATVRVVEDVEVDRFVLTFVSLAVFAVIALA